MGTDCILPPVPVRTSTAVTLGLILLAVVGVGTIFGNTILAVVAPAAPPPATPAAPTAPGGSGRSAAGSGPTGPAPAAADTSRGAPAPAEPPAAKDGSS